ncbi:hypothetical protein [Rhizobium gallicum]|uniref:hypothetical protein n=1 Tax=Rhizobium gallicum TaxID=56730 RepID=UPI00093DFFDD
MRDIIRVLALATAATVSGSALGQTTHPQDKPTIVLVHGAFAESSSWSDVIGELRRMAIRPSPRPIRFAASPEMQRPFRPSSARSQAQS